MYRKTLCDGKCLIYFNFEAPENLHTHLFIYNNISIMHYSYSLRVKDHFYLKLTSVVVLLLNSCRTCCEVAKVSIHYNTTNTARLYLKFIKGTNSSSNIPAMML